MIFILNNAMFHGHYRRDFNYKNGGPPDSTSAKFFLSDMYLKVKYRMAKKYLTLLVSITAVIGYIQNP